jgi:hypothetical protein
LKRRTGTSAFLQICQDRRVWKRAHWLVGEVWKIKRPIEEENFEDEGKGEKYGNGHYMVMMKIEKEIPELLPMYNQKVRVRYQHIKRCAKNA